MMPPTFGISKIWAPPSLTYKRKAIEVSAPGVIPFPFSFPLPVASSAFTLEQWEQWS